jgi:replicative DNA helicase
MEQPGTVALTMAAEVEAAATGAVDYERDIESLGKHVERDLTPILEQRRTETTPPGILTGWPEVDETYIQGGLQPGRVTVLMAARKTGKSTIAAHLALKAGQQGKVCGLYSLEMSRSEVGLKLIAQASGLPVLQTSLGRLDGHDWEQWRRTAEVVGAMNIYVNDRRGVQVYGVLSWARRLKRERGLDLLIVDYLQLVAPHLKGETMERNVSDVARQFVIDAQRLNCHVVLLAQMNMEGAAKWSGQTNDDAHCNWRVIRTDERGDPDPDGGYFKFHVEQRFGVSGTVPKLYTYDAANGRIEQSIHDVRPPRQLPTPEASRYGNG